MRGGFELTSGRITINGATVYSLVALAHGMLCVAASNLGLISGAPDWVQKETFNIQATLPEGTPLYTFQQLQNDEAPKLQAMGYLGFKLESTHGPVESIVIDHVDRPTEN